MRLIKKRLLQNHFHFFITLIILSVSAQSCVLKSHRKSDKKLEKMFSDPVNKLKIERVNLEKRTIRYAEIGGDESSPVVILIHGAPGTLSGSSKIYFEDKELLQRATLVSIDRPGYGYSNFGRAVTSLEMQAALLKPILEKYKDRPKILVGSSYGGPVIARIAADYPELVDALVFVSASVAPGEEKIYRISYPANKKAFRWMVPKTLRVANDEKLSHKEELAKLEPLLENICSPATIIHGTADKLIYPQNGSFLQEKLVNSNSQLFMLENKDHFIIWHTPEIVKEAIIKYLDGFQNPEFADAEQ
jgi:pimeloyl-ACP methyl ester carboxylesterase